MSYPSYRVSYVFECWLCRPSAANIALNGVTTSEQFHEKNHYVPRGYLRRWAAVDGRLWAYRLLVPHDRVEPWKAVTPNGVAKHAHLYTRLIAGQESDDIERWFDAEFETPAQGALNRAVADDRLSQEDWVRIIRYVAAQDVRTPASFEAHSRRWNKQMPEFIESTLESSIAKLERMVSTGETVLQEPVVRDDLPIRITTRREPGQETAEVGAQVLLGRSFWLWSVRQVLDQTWKVLKSHKWTILKPPEGTCWFTTDNPVVRLNYNGPKDYDFGGGWGSNGSEIMMPLSPQHLLYTRIGHRAPMRGGTMPVAEAAIARRMMAEHAHRVVFAAQPDPDVETLRPRIVDLAAYTGEIAHWEKFHERQTAAELEMFGDVDGQG